MNLRRALYTGLLLLMFAGCGSASTSGTKITVVLDWTPNTNHLGVYDAKLKGYYADAGLDVEIIEPDQNGALAQLAAGKKGVQVLHAIPRQNGHAVALADARLRLQPVG